MERITFVIKSGQFYYVWGGDWTEDASQAMRHATVRSAKNLIQYLRDTGFQDELLIHTRGEQR